MWIQHGLGPPIKQRLPVHPTFPTERGLLLHSPTPCPTRPHTLPCVPHTPQPCAPQPAPCPPHHLQDSFPAEALKRIKKTWRATERH